MSFVNYKDFHMTMNCYFDFVAKLMLIDVIEYVLYYTCLLLFFITFALTIIRE